jgi:hypothetical protein
MQERQHHTPVTNLQVKRGLGGLHCSDVLWPARARLQLRQQAATREHTQRRAGAARLANVQRRRRKWRATLATPACLKTASEARLLQADAPVAATYSSGATLVMQSQTRRQHTTVTRHRARSHKQGAAHPDPRGAAVRRPQGRLSSCATPSTSPQTPPTRLGMQRERLGTTCTATRHSRNAVSTCRHE